MSQRPAVSERDVKAAIAGYRRFHWGRAGADDVRRLRAADPARPLVAIGELVRVVYQTRKGARGVLTDYHHDFNQTQLPILAFEPRSRLLVITGGIYDVQTRGIVD